METGRFSVLVPSFNHKRFLGAALRSALQSELVHEVLVADDGSTDGSIELLVRFARRFPERIRVLPTEGNQGAATRINQMVEHVSCDWISVLNSDDWFLAGRFRAIRAAIEIRRPSMLFGYLLIVDSEGRPTGAKRAARDPEFSFPAGWRPADWVDQGKHLPLLANQNYVATTSNMTFDRSIHRDLGGFRSFRYVHDWDFALRASACATLHVVPHFLTAYRSYPGNTIRESRAAVCAEVAAMVRGVVADHPELMSNPEFRRGIEENPYLASAS